MSRECRRMVEGGGMAAAYPCELQIDDVDTQHPGPCMTKDMPVSVTRRLQWARENNLTDEVERIGRQARGVLNEFQGQGRTAGEAMDGGTAIPDAMNTRITPDEADDERAASPARAVDPPLPPSDRMTPGGGTARTLVDDVRDSPHVHAMPPDDSVIMPCCGRSMRHLPMHDSISPNDDAVTCHVRLDANEEAIELIEQWREAEPLHRAPRGVTIDQELIDIVAFAIAYGRSGVRVDVT